MAQAEEEEALLIQKRLLQDIDEANLHLPWDSYTNDNKASFKNIREPEKLEFDYSILSEEEKMNVLKKDSPELLPLIDDFKLYINESKKIKPLLDIISNERFSKFQNLPLFSFLNTKYNTILRYLVNLSFYFVLKAQKISIKNHPVIKQILTYKNLISQLERLSEENDLDTELSNITEMMDLDDISNLLPVEELILDQNEFYDKSVDIEKSFVEDEEDDEKEEDGEEEDEGMNETARREITYKIAKNKGLTVRKRKELRNPRVKHRMKFKKAKVRRKGQVREPRKEVQKYGGEISGIKSSLVRSIKFK